ncbi:MAG: hypothetical protein R3C68_09955 [Myxococcota bacterium]
MELLVDGDGVAIQGAAPDIGAYEFGVAPPVVVKPPPVPIEPLCDPKLEDDCLYFYAEAETQDINEPTTVVLRARLREGLIPAAIWRISQIDFLLNVPTSGDYIVWARVLAPSGSADSFFVSANGDAEDIYDAAEGTWSAQWQWTRGQRPQWECVHKPQSGRIFGLNTGTNTLSFRSREVDAGLDVDSVTDDVDFVPTGVPRGWGGGQRGL